MTEFLKKLKELDNFTETENGAIALSSTGSDLLDAFSSLGAMRDCSEKEIIKTFEKAFSEEPELAMKLLFYIRDVRGGQGERRTFRIIVKHLAKTHPELILNNLDNFLFFGRGDDLLCLLDTPIEKEVIAYIAKVIKADLEAICNKQHPTLLAKWLPSENASSKETKRLARKLIKGLEMSPSRYRKILSLLREKITIVESLMSANKWEEIDFEKLPSRAAMIYSDAFLRHVEDNYIKYLHDAFEGNAKINAGALFPVDIIHRVLNTYSPNIKDIYLLDAMWKSLPNYFGDNDETGICVVDTSGSMMGKPLEVALSLGLYCADKAKGPFKNHFITFSANPKLQEIKGSNIIEKVRNMEDSDWMMNTDIEKVFSLILKTAVVNNLPPEDLPKKLYIISDMQWDQSVRQDTKISKYNLWGGLADIGLEVMPETFIQTMSKLYSEYGYDLPAIVYWNVRESDCGMYQQTKDSDNCCMVSGYSPSLFKAVIEGTDFVEEEIIRDGKTETIIKQEINPINVMLKTLNNERYDRVVTKE